jgi:hypothetical protein
MLNLLVLQVTAGSKMLKLAGFAADSVEPLLSITRVRFSTLFLTKRTSLSPSLYISPAVFDQFSSNSRILIPLADTLVTNCYTTRNTQMKALHEVLLLHDSVTMDLAIHDCRRSRIMPYFAERGLFINIGKTPRCSCF